VTPLPSLLADLLGTPFLFRESAKNFASWTAAANLLAHWQWDSVDFAFTYDRSISNANLLNKPADTQTFKLSASRLLGSSASLTGSLLYGQNRFFSVQNYRRLDQGTVTVSLSRPLVTGLDLSVFASYARLLRGIGASSSLDHVQGGIRFIYHVPRVQPVRER
jgi:hypothetical protein